MKKTIKFIWTVCGVILIVALLCGLIGCNNGGETEETTAPVTSGEEGSVKETDAPEADGTTLGDVTTREPEVTDKEPDTTTSEPTDTTAETPTQTTEEPANETEKDPSEESTAENDDIIPLPPVQIEDLPADADGYAYPEFFKNKITQWLVIDRVLSNYKYYNQMCMTEPEIIFVDREESSKDEHCPIVIYAKYTLNELGTNTQYVRFVGSIRDRDYTYLGAPSLYKSYSEYVGAIQKAMETKCEFVDAEISTINEKDLDDLNNQIGEGFAKFIGDEFVDAEVNFGESKIYYISGELYSKDEYYGFVYDKDGKSYSFSLKIRKGDYYNGNKQIVLDIENGSVKREDCESVEVTTKRIDSVFTKESE